VSKISIYLDHKGTTAAAVTDLWTNFQKKETYSITYGLSLPTIL
jgi:hypothetical protein